MELFKQLNAYARVICNVLSAVRERHGATIGVSVQSDNSAYYTVCVKLGNLECCELFTALEDLCKWRDLAFAVVNAHSALREQLGLYPNWLSIEEVDELAGIRTWDE